MQIVKTSKDKLDSFKKDTLFTLEEVNSLTEDIPLPNKANRKNIRVIFSSYASPFYLTLKGSKIKKYKFSYIVDTDETLLGCIFVIELAPCSKTNSQYYLIDKTGHNARNFTLMKL